MATRTARRGIGARVILAASVIALAAGIMPASALDPAPAVVRSSVDNGWSGSDRLITVLFDKPISYVAAGTATTVRLTHKNADGTADVVMPIEDIAASNELLSIIVGPQANPDGATLPQVRMWSKWGEYTLTIHAVPRESGVASTGTTAEPDPVLKFKLDGAAPSINMFEPSDSLPNFLGLRDGPLVLPNPLGGDLVLHIDGGVAVYTALDPIRLTALITDRGDKYGPDNAGTWIFKKGFYSSGLRRVELLATNLITEDTSPLKIWTAADGSKVAAWVNTACTPAACDGSYLDLLDHTEDDVPGDDKSMDISAAVGPGAWSLQLVATDLSGLRAYTKPMNIVRLG
jgi:hypothetical protein